MPSSVSSIFAAAGLRRLGVVTWGSEIAVDEPGVYVVALDEDPDTPSGHLPEAPIAGGAIEHLLAVRPEVRVDGRPPTKGELRERLQQFWLPDETILYIGLASQSIRTRVDAYYRTKLGARSPHAGGWFLKTLEPGPARYVHWATTADPAGAEGAMLRAFCDGVSEATRASLRDPERPFPFANLEWPPGTRKRHGITGAKAPRSPSIRRTNTAAGRDSEGSSEVSAAPTDRASTGGSAFRVVPAGPVPSTLERRAQSQNVTDADLGRNQIRFPSNAKQFFPSTKQPVSVRIRGHMLEASWDPRVGPDRERSGILRFKAGDLSGITAGTLFTVERSSTGEVQLR